MSVPVVGHDGHDRLRIRPWSVTSVQDEGMSGHDRLRTRSWGAHDGPVKHEKSGNQEIVPQKRNDGYESTLILLYVLL